MLPKREKPTTKNKVQNKVKYFRQASPDALPIVKHALAQSNRHHERFSKYHAIMSNSCSKTTQFETNCDQKTIPMKFQLKNVYANLK